MKIEKVNDNQIRCTLTREDLADRQLKLSELAYGTEKAKSLFREMMQQASYEFGFEAEDIPLMIEAIPISSETIILIITKVEYPEELDTRFSKFSDTEPDEEYGIYDDDDSEESIPSTADDILEMFNRYEQRKKEQTDAKEFIPLNKAISQNVSSKTGPKEDADIVSIPTDIAKLFTFTDLDTVIHLSHVLDGFYDNQNTLYKKPGTKKYYLSIHKGSHSPEDFNKVCNIIAEYSRQEKHSQSTVAYFDEHYDILVQSNAIQTLATI